MILDMLMRLDEIIIWTILIIQQDPCEPQNGWLTGTGRELDPYNYPISFYFL